MSPRGRRALVVGVVALTCLLVAGVAATAVGLRTPPQRFSALFTQTVGLYEGSDVRVLGVKVGRVTAVEPEGGHVRVDMDVDPDVRIAADADAVIVAPTLVSDRYVQLTRPWSSGEALASGTVLDLDRTAVPVEVDDLYQSLDDLATTLGPEGANREGALSDLIKTGARNLKGNGARVRQVVTDLGDASRTLADTGEDTFESFNNLSELADVLAANDTEVDDATQKLARLTRLLSDDRRVLTRAITLLSGAMVDLEGFIRDNRGHITRSVRGLASVTGTLVRRKAELARVLGVAPVVLSNVLDSYDARGRLFVTRGNPNDVTLWGSPDVGVTPSGPPAGLRSPSAPVAPGDDTPEAPTDGGGTGGTGGGGFMLGDGGAL